MDTNEKVRENKARREARRQGFVLKKSRARNWNIDNYQGYMIVNAWSNNIESGIKFDMSLEEVERFLKEE